jgi:hypothetical protein
MTYAQDLSFIYNNTLTIAGNILPASDVTYNVGTSTTRYNILYCSQLSAGSTSTGATIAGQWTLLAGSRLQATYADLAEYYEADTPYDVGTVLIFGGEREVTTTKISSDRRVAGVVSNTAAYEMNKGCPGIATCIALQGRVPVKVVGIVRKGDILVTSTTEGYAIVKNDPTPGTAIGKAITVKDTPEAGLVEVAVGRF